MIIFKKLRWKNFLSTGNIFTEIDLAKSNNTLSSLLAISVDGYNDSSSATEEDALKLSFVG